jgi:folate-binding protein YgfZ
MTDATQPAIMLEDRAVMSLSGPDTLSLLQGLVTVDVEHLDLNQAAHGALLTPQGKVQFDFLILRNAEDGILLDVSAGIAADMVKRLMFYRLRAKVDIGLRPDLVVVSLPEGSANLPEGSHSFADPRHDSLGMRAFVPAAGSQEALALSGHTLDGVAAYHAARIAAGIPEAPHDFALGSVFPHDIALDQTGGVDFHKGCFVGQEVVSRMQHRGTARRRVVQVSITGDAPAPGTPLTLNGKSVGEMGAHAGDHGLAIIRLDRAASALGGAALEADTAQLCVSLPAWSDYALPAQPADSSAPQSDESAA